MQWLPRAEWAEARAKANEKYSIKNASNFVGVETPSRSILFVIDVSGSMEDLVVDYVQQVLHKVIWVQIILEIMI